MSTRKRSADSPAHRRHVHRRTGSGSSRSSRSSGHQSNTPLPKIPENEHFFRDSDEIDLDYMYDTDNCAYTEEDASTHDLDGTSVLEEADAEEAKYFGKGRGCKWDSKCTEWKILHEESADVGALIKEIRENPRQSQIATMGLKAIREIKMTNQINQSRWESNAATFRDKAQASMLEETNLKPAYDEAYENLKKANEDHHHLQQKIQTIHASTANFEAHCKKYERRARIAGVVVGVLSAFTADSPDLKVSKDTTTQGMRDVLGLPTLQDCLDLPREEALAVLRIMAVFAYDETDAFQGLWKIPPGCDHFKWHSIYGMTPNLNTGKGNSSILQLTHRVAHYLGFTIPPSAKPSAPPVPPVAVVVAPLTIEGMALEEKLAMIARLQAAVELEGRNGGPDSGTA